MGKGSYSRMLLPSGVVAEVSQLVGSSNRGTPYSDGRGWHRSFVAGGNPLAALATCYQMAAIVRPAGRRDSWIAAVEGRILSPAFATSAVVVVAVAVASE